MPLYRTHDQRLAARNHALNPAARPRLSKRDANWSALVPPITTAEMEAERAEEARRERAERDPLGR